MYGISAQLQASWTCIVLQQLIGQEYNGGAVCTVVGGRHS